MTARRDVFLWPSSSTSPPTAAGRCAHAALALVALLALAVVAPGCDDDAAAAGDAGPAGGAGGGGAGGGPGGGGGGGAGGGGGGQGGDGGDGGGEASCMDDAGCPPGGRCDRAANVCRPACRDDDQCGVSARCGAGGFCTPLPACPGGAGDCAAGSACDCHGYCVPTAGAACASDLSCPVEDFCDACTGHCAPRGTPCQRCAAENGCERRNDVCHPVGPAGLNHCLRGCTGAANCDALGPGYRCEMLPGGRQACVPESGDCRAVAGCANDGDCPSAHYCNDRLQCQRGCTADVECPQGLLCQGIRCAAPCTVDADCGPNAACGEGGKCGVPPGGCLSSADCTEPATYCDVENQRCVPGCQRDDDCLNATQACDAGNCVTRGCTGNFQCAFGEVCNLEAARCELAMGRHCEADCNPEESETSCGNGGQRCLSLQDEEENPLGDFCFEPCAPEPNECPQGYQCVELESQDGMVEARLCIRRCDLDPFR